MNSFFHQCNPKQNKGSAAVSFYWIHKRVCGMPPRATTGGCRHDAVTGSCGHECVCRYVFKPRIFKPNLSFRDMVGGL